MIQVFEMVLSLFASNKRKTSGFRIVCSRDFSFYGIFVIRRLDPYLARPNKTVRFHLLSSMQVPFLFLAFFFTFSLALPMDSEEEELGILPEIEASKNDKAEARFIFVQAYATVYQTVGTSTLSTYP